MPRKYIKHSIDELEAMVVKHRHQNVILAEILEELEHRTTDRGKQLRREVRGILDGELQAPERKLRRARPEDQLKLLDPE